MRVQAAIFAPRGPELLEPAPAGLMFAIAASLASRGSAQAAPLAALMGALGAGLIALMGLAASEAMAGAGISGFLEAYYSARLHSPNDALAARARVRLEGRAEAGDFMAFGSFEAQKDWAYSGADKARLKELWLEWSHGSLDFRIGRQIIIWGQADGIQITDVICPSDYSMAPAKKLDEVRLGVDAALIRISGGRYELELVWMPFFRAAELPTRDNPWRFGGDWPGAREIRPKRSLSSSEAALRFSGHWPGFDAAVSAFWTRSDLPVAAPGPDGRPVLSWPRLAIFGFSASKPSGDLVWRLEAALRTGESRQAFTVGPAGRALAEPLKTGSLKWLLGLDWTPGGDWTISGQISGEEIIDPPEGLWDARDPLAGTLSVQKKLFGQLATVSNMVFLDFRDRSFYDAFEIEHQIRDGFLAAVGADMFGGRGGRFGELERNTQAWVRLKWHF